MAIGPQDNLLKILLSPKCNSCNKQTNATIPQTMQVLEAIADVYQGWVGRGERENRGILHWPNWHKSAQ